jgi:hypothetical protein
MRHLENVSGKQLGEIKRKNSKKCFKSSRRKEEVKK